VGNKGLRGYGTWKNIRKTGASLVRDTTTPHTPGILYEYQNKGLANWAIRNCMKIKKIARGKNGQNRDL
jgi:hypothetical protein